MVIGISPPLVLYDIDGVLTLERNIEARWLQAYGEFKKVACPLLSF
jgi:hypothetical protein